MDIEFCHALNFPAGGIDRFPALKLIDCVGHTPMHVPQEKQSGMIRSRFNTASITVDGHAFEHASQAIQVS